ncbi:nuclear transport factor 2 family protein [Pseudonocardia sp. RS11V-5]|uniref:nuclear transport factor 2 family protein n=1 Tax=Pseudonocardia terrae TaxID=2905831 RepID=UPI001E4CA85D|nr:limonene-1,2-epoxide hydrolase family protein [Pseudonocardia terrae]MCE3551138.1 nuclear transport factor 2 family protein [Pseudonocardia terrae]
MMTPADRSAGDTVRAFLAALGEGERSDLAEYLAEDAEYRGTGIQRPTVGAEPIARLLGMLYAGTGTTAEVVTVEARDGVVFSERRDHLRSGEALRIQAVATVAERRITSWADVDPDDPVRPGRLLGRPATNDTRGRGWRPTSTLN